MKTLKSFIAMLLFISFYAPLTQAQPAPDKRQDAQATNTIAQDVLIIIQQEQVRFTAQRAVAEMQLQIFDQAGQLVYDSGAVTGQELTWVLRQANGETVKSGLYAYTLSIKEAGKEVGKEAGAADARVRRGHFIVDRASERDGQTDRLWITSQNDSGVGTELTVARNEGVTIAGTSATSEHKSVQVAKGAPGNGEGASKNEDNVAAAEAANGTTGRIAKFTSAIDLGDSVMTELNSKIGIGTTSPISKLHILSGASDNLPPRLESSGNTTFAAGLDFYHGATGKGYVGVPGSATGLASGEMLVFGAAGTKTSLWAGGGRVVTLDTNGNVGVGTTTPRHLLSIASGPRWTTNNWGGAMELENGNAIGWKTNTAGNRFGIGHTNGGLFFFRTTSDPGTAVSQANYDLMITDSGSVGIGTIVPTSKLEIVAQDALNMVGFQPFLTLTDSNAGWARTRIQNVNGGISFQTNHQILVGGSTMYIQDVTQNIGIGTPNPQARLHVQGATMTSVLQITGGADFAENFDVNLAATGSEATTATVEAGSVVSIDPASPGKLALSMEAYDRRVAGIVSGANGVKPGMIMSQEGTLADGKHPVALSGRVYCWADASQGAIEPGDLLTTSRTPGHAMKAADTAKAQGAIIGKAMTGLKEGKGLVLVLVTLQ